MACGGFSVNVDELRRELKRKDDAGEEVTEADLIRWGVVRVLTEEEYQRRRKLEALVEHFTGKPYRRRWGRG